MPSIETFTTTHLSAGRLRAEDLDELCGLFQDQRVMATLGGPLLAEETRQALQRGLEHWDRYGYGFWMFRDRADGRFVGRAGLRNVAFTLPTNRVSQRVMEKAGFSYERDIVHAGMPHVLYGVRAASRPSGTIQGQR